MGRTVNYSGLVIAAIGFFTTRFTVTLVIYDDPIQFYLVGVAPLGIGLGLAAFGVALTVADVDPALVRTTAIWCVIGFGSMLILVVLTLLGTAGPGEFATIRERTALSTFLIGGSVGGTLTGLYAARNRRQRNQLRQQSNRLVILNRILRHEILNSVSAIRGYAAVDPTENTEAMSVIDNRSKAIQDAVEEVKYLARRTASDQASRTRISLADCLSESVETARERHPAVTIEYPDVPEDVQVYANERFSQVVTHLLENAIVHGSDESPALDVSIRSDTVAISVRDEGPGLPERQRSILETGDIEQYDDPTTGFGLNIVRLLIESYDGAIDTEVDHTGTTITITLARAGESTDHGPIRADLANIRPAFPHLLVGIIASVIAGAVYGVSSETLGGSIAAIGVFYGTSDVVVGWLTHQFHSIVFGFVYLGLLSVSLERFRNTLATYVTVGVAWSLVVWFVAASFVAPGWLTLLGIEATVPSFSGVLLVNHLVWGITLSLLTAVGYRYVNRVQPSGSVRSGKWPGWSLQSGE